MTQELELSRLNQPARTIEGDDQGHSEDGLGEEPAFTGPLNTTW